MMAAHRKFGTTAFLPTLIRDTPEKTRAAMAAAESLVEEESSVLGIHLEGPYLSPERAGVHNPNLMRIPDTSDLEILCGDRRGVLLVTLAPERVPKGFIARLVKSGVRVSLGHSVATYEETCAAMAGQRLRGFTHLFNAMRPLNSREPGPIARGARDAGCMVRNNCRRCSCKFGHAASRIARPRPSNACDGCDASCGR